jgi:hypothetical protein
MGCYPRPIFDAAKKAPSNYLSDAIILKGLVMLPCRQQDISSIPSLLESTLLLRMVGFERDLSVATRWQRAEPQPTRTSWQTEKRASSCGEPMVCQTSDFKEMFAVCHVETCLSDNLSHHGVELIHVATLESLCLAVADSPTGCYCTDTCYYPGRLERTDPFL